MTPKKTFAERANRVVLVGMTENNSSCPEPLSEHARNVDAIYVKHRAELIGVARKYRLPPEIIKEVLNESRAKVMMADVASIRDLRAYIFTAVSHLAIDKFRKLKRVRRNDMLLYRNARTGESHPPPELEYAAEQALEALNKYLQSLPPPLRRAAELLIYDKQSVRNVAQATKLSEHKVRKLLLELIKNFTRNKP